MMSSNNVSEETPHPTINVTDGSCSLSMFWRTEESRCTMSISSDLQSNNPAHQKQDGGEKSTVKVPTEFRQQQKCCFQLWKEMWSHKPGRVGRSNAHFSNLNRWGIDNNPPSLAALGSPGPRTFPFHQEETLSRALLLLRELPSICLEAKLKHIWTQVKRPNSFRLGLLANIPLG